jgi:Laminin G domain
MSLLVVLALSLWRGFAQESFSARPNLNAPDALTKFTLDGSGSWEVADGKLILSKAGTPGGPIRRPAALAILKSGLLVRATVQVEMRSTAALEVRNRDLEIIFDYVSPTHFYYVHLAGITDAVHNGIFLVDEKDRRRIDDGKAAPQLTDREWHRVRLERDGSTGRIEVFVDGAGQPALKATDTTIRSGRVGLGSFDDTGEFRKLEVTGLDIK